MASKSSNSLRASAASSSITAWVVVSSLPAGVVCSVGDCVVGLPGVVSALVSVVAKNPWIRTWNYYTTW